MEFETDLFNRIVFYVNNSTEKYAIKNFCESRNLIEKADYLIVIKEATEL